MSGWDDGYVTDVTYTTNFYREITPVWLATTCLLLGQRAPDLTRPFRYADLGCGHGFSMLVAAAAHPHAEFRGFDFNPAHVEWANRIAGVAGLDNVRFEEASFAELAARTEPDLPDFDFIVSHGVLSWISPENRRLMLDVIRRRLKPGGLLYLSYNVTTGWAAMVPLRRLMRMLAETNPARTDRAAGAILDFIDRMKQSGALFFTANPRLETRLEDIRKQDPRYIAHEYLNRDWHPMMFADLAEELADTKCGFVGSATLTENIDALAAPPEALALLTEANGPVLRQTLRDFASGQAFRRDVYRRGVSPVPPGEQQKLLEEMTVAPMGQSAPDPIVFNTPVGTVTGRPDVYQPLFDLLADGPFSLRRAHAMEPYAGHPLGDLLQAVTLMIAGGYAHPVVPGGLTAAARQAAMRLNRAIAAENGYGAELPRLAAPLIGSTLQVDLLETLMAGDLLAGHEADLPSMTASVLEGLKRTGRSMQRDGKPVSDPVDQTAMSRDVAERFLERRVPVLRMLGGI